jgi:endoglucanase
MTVRLFMGPSLTALLACAVPLIAAEPSAFEACQALGRGVNLGNALEAPQEGDWGVTIQAEYFAKIKAAGFDHVRVPTKWSAHASKREPYPIEPAFFERIDWVLAQAAKNKLGVVLNVHHYDEMNERPDEELPRCIAIWKQIATRYRDQPSSLYFELMNEPHGKLNDEGKWNEVLPKVLAAVRESNPMRPVIIGGAWWNGIWALPKFELPDDPHLILTVHYYSPHEFTHQGASWTPGSEKWLGRKWTGTEAELEALRNEFDRAAKYAKEHRVPVYLGEFGVYEKADMTSRANWTRAVAREAERRGFSWAYWEFGAGFGVYDRQQGEFRKELLGALFGQ